MPTSLPTSFAALRSLRDGGTFGLIATNTIGQGDTRSTGLRWICNHGGTIYAARKRLKWPGEAAVVVSVVHVHKGPMAGRSISTADSRASSPPISSTPAATTTRSDSTPMRARASRAAIVLGMGFTFDDTDKKGIASPITRAGPTNWRSRASGQSRWRN